MSKLRWRNAPYVPKNLSRGEEIERHGGAIRPAILITSPHGVLSTDRKGCIVRDLFLMEHDGENLGTPTDRPLVIRKANGRGGKR